MEMEFDITKMVEEIVMQAKENQEEFIFETIRPYCEDVLQMKINKEELKKILLNGMQKQQPSEDCISREDAKNLFWDGTEGYDCRGFTRMEIGEMLDDLPSVTPQRPKGKWIDDSKEDSYYANCSHCDYQIDTHYEIGYLNYCPNCGAKMREVEE